MTNSSHNIDNDLIIRGMSKLRDFACKNLEIRGMTSAVRGVVAQSATIRGATQLESVTIQHNLCVRGMTHLEAVTIHGDVCVRGMTNIEKGSIQGDVCIHGMIKIEQSTIQGSMRVAGKVFLENSKVHAIQVISSSGCYSKIGSIERSSTGSITIEMSGIKSWLSWCGCVRPRIQLEDSVVDGDITFVGCKGIVILEGSSRITGHVIGGIIK